MKNITTFLGILLIISCKSINVKIAETPQTFCNPININYRFMKGCPGSREAADPVFLHYKGDYYLFASKSSGYWWSNDFSKWNYVYIADSILPIESYAPAALIHNDEVYFVSSAWGQGELYKSSDPKNAKWEVAGIIERGWDPGIFIENDSLYLYYGSSNVDPVSAFAMSLNNFELNGKGRPIIKGKPDIHGWERTGENNDEPNAPYIEGAWMTKYKDKYYLQYSGPGTQWKSYADGVYVSTTSPTSGFEYQNYNPVTYKPTGFLGGSGHGCMFEDTKNKLWRAGTASISVNHWFERRIAIFPSGFDKDDVMYSNTQLGDYPIFLPGSGKDGFAGWMLLSYGKPVSVSSEIEGHEKEKAVDEDIRSYWAANSNSAEEWYMIDLNKRSLINAIQVNFAEHGATFEGRHDGIFQQYKIFASNNGKDWSLIVDKSENMEDVPHDYIEFEEGFKARYIKIENVQFTSGNSFCLRDLRIFGNEGGKKPASIEEFNIARDKSDGCIMNVKWNMVDNAEGYIVKYGIAPDKLYNQFEVRGADNVKIPSLNKDTEYFVRIDTFNPSGITESEYIQKVAVQ